MILHGEYSTCNLFSACFIDYFFLAQLLHACHDLGAHHAVAASAPDEKHPYIKHPHHYRNLQATMGLADDYW
jgi:hypothetical protein